MRDSGYGDKEYDLHLTAKDLLASAGNLGTKARVFDDNDVRQLLRAAVERAGTQVAFAKRHHLDRTHLNQVLKGKSRISSSLLKCLGLRKAYILDQTGSPYKTAAAYSLAPALDQLDASTALGCDRGHRPYVPEM